MEILSPQYGHGLASMGDDDFAAFMGEATSGEDQKRAKLRLLDEGRQWWEARSRFRERRREARNFYAGKQWEKWMDDPDKPGRRIKEKDYITRQGRLALVMNLVSNTINNVDGQFRSNKSERLAFAVERVDEEAVKMMNLARRASRRFNDSAVIEADQFKEHALSGASCFKSTYEWVPELNRQEVRDYEVDQTRLFFNTDIADRRFTSLRLIGELHDVPLEQVIAQFARSRRDAERIVELYGKTLSSNTYDLIPSAVVGFDAEDGIDFLNPEAAGLCRVVEVWYQKYSWVRVGLDPLFEVIAEGYGEVTLPENEITRIQNERRAQGLPLLELDEPRYEPQWHYCFLTPTGEDLASGPTPFRHGSHPYSPGLALLVDGETWGLVESIIDPQRWLNRLVANIDHMMGAGAKGGIAYDQTFLHETGLEQRDVDDWYVRANGSLNLKVPQGKKLKEFLEQYTAQQIPEGYFELLPVIQQWIERISGVTDALQGLAPKSGTPATLYQDQIRQAATSILGHLETYFETLRQKDRKELKLLAQAISEPRAFPDNHGQMVVYDPSRVGGLDFDVAIGDVADTATYRQLWEQDLLKYWESGAIPFELYLQMSSHPRSEELLRALQNFAATQGMPPQMAAALEQQMGDLLRQNAGGATS